MQASEYNCRRYGRTDEAAVNIIRKHPSLTVQQLDILGKDTLMAILERQASLINKIIAFLKDTSKDLDEDIDIPYSSMYDR